jgi:hypothetical protein
MMERRVRTAWLVRQRFRRAANLATLAGILLALLLVAAARPATPEGWVQFGFVTGALGVLLVGAVAPRLAVQAVWRVVRWRNHEEWG